MFGHVAKHDYNQQHWLESADGFEKGLVLYQEALQDCYMMCEDIIQVNLTDPNMDSQKITLYEDIKISADSMEYYELLATIVKEVRLLICVQIDGVLVYIIVMNFRI